MSWMLSRVDIWSIHSCRIRLFRNGDPYFPGKKINISPIHHRLFEQFMTECSKDVNLRIKRIYTMEGSLVKELQEFQDGKCYIASSGDSFKRIQYNDSESGPNFMAYSKPNLLIPPVKDNPLLERKKTNASAGGLLSEGVTNKGSEATLFTPETKAFRIAVFENGNFNMDGVRIILNYRNCKSFDQLLRYFSSLKITKSGQVRKMYDVATGRRIRHLSSIENGINLVLSAFDPFRKGNYKTILFRNNTTAGIKKRDEEGPRVIKVFPNGDAYHNGVGISVTKRNHPTLQRLMEKANSQIELVTGMIKKLYSTDGVQIMSIDDIKNGCGYVAVSNNDPFMKVNYNSMDLSKRPGTSYKGLQGHTLTNEFLGRIRPITKRGKREESKPMWGSNRPHTTTSKPVQTPSNVKSKKQGVVGDGMETESVGHSVPKQEKIKSVEVIKKEEQEEIDVEKSRTLVPDQDESAVQSDSEKVEKEEQFVPKSQNVTSRAKTAKARPKTTTAQFEDPLKPLPPLSREQSTDGKTKISLSREHSIKLKREQSNSATTSVAKTPNTQESFEIQEDDQLQGDSGRGEEELFQSESLPVQILESVSPKTSNKKGWFSK